ncbi:SRPBCC family protein [Nonomuraea bangladeshensis]|uniref:SRPBCC family protein n=1 Tax=Nonomuraea bangladeshensis TaxID=404385 RepID=A0ABV3GZX6_9ACTN
MITISEELAVPSPPTRVWEIISDPAKVVSCIGGAELGASHEDGSFDGTLVVKFGAVRVKFAAVVTLELDPETLEGRLSARGRDGQRATRFTAEATFRVRPADGETQVRMEGEISLNGKLASLVEAGAGAVVSRMTREFSDELIQLCAPEKTPEKTPEKAPKAPKAAPGIAPVAITPTPPARSLFRRLRAWWARLWRNETHAKAE